MLAVDIDPQPITNWLALVIAIGTVITLVGGVIVRVNRNFEKRVTSLIMETTKPIQPGTNGGLSMTDLHNKVDRFERRYEQLVEEQEKQRQLWHDRYLADQSRIRLEWTSVFIAIRKMIHLPPPEQAAMWDEITEDYINGTLTEKYNKEMEGTDG